MKRDTAGCRSVRPRLQAFLDNELPVSAYAAVRKHLDVCVACGAELEDYRALGRALRSGVDATAVPTEALAEMASRVVSLTSAETRFSVRMRLLVAFEDMRFVFAGAGAFVATLACALALGGILHAASRENADSLAGLMARMSARGTTQNPFSVDPRLLPPTLDEDSLVMPVVLIDNVPYGVRDEDYAFSAVVTPDGRVAGVEMLSGSDAYDARSLELLRSIHGARLAPARLKDGRRVAVSFVWIHSDLTIKPNKTL